MKETVQLVPPALAGRKQRIQDFKQFIEANRKDKSPTQLVALYSLQTGISKRTVDGYLKLFIEAKVYVTPWLLRPKRVLTPGEYEKARAEHSRKQEEARKRREAEANRLHTDMDEEFLE